MDIKTYSDLCIRYSFDNALENVKDLVYDPATKQLCLRSKNKPTSVDSISLDSHRFNINQDMPHKFANSSNEQVDKDIQFCDSGISSDSYTENESQKSYVEIEPGDQLYNTESPSDVDTGDLPLNINQTSKSKKYFIQNVLNRFTSSAQDKQQNVNEVTADNNCYETASLSSIDAISSSDNSCTSELVLGKRPQHLPPKSEDEERRHRNQINQLIKQARKRELKEIKIKRRILSKKFLLEEEVSDSIRYWTNEILPTWNTSHTSKRAREIWWNGIPSPVRSKVWSLAIGNDLNITEELFRICVERSKERVWTKQFIQRRSSNPYSPNAHVKVHRRAVSSISQELAQSNTSNRNTVDKITDKLNVVSLNERSFKTCAKNIDGDCHEDEEDKNESIAFLIKLDVSRTFPQLGLFQELGPYHKSLSDILTAYAVYRPDLGYCQGMSFLAAMLLLNLDSPCTAFTAFANFLNNELLLSFYRLNQNEMKTIYSYYDRQFQLILPKLSAHFASIGLKTELFLVDQIYTLFSRSLPLECACRIWDLFFRDGNEFIFRASFAILSMYEEVLIELEFVDSARFLSKLPDDMNIEKYFDTIASIKLIAPKLPECFEPKSSYFFNKNDESNYHSTGSFVRKLFHF